jgi:hypothetical protein
MNLNKSRFFVCFIRILFLDVYFQMENPTLRIRLVSFKDSTKQNLDNTLYYIKKLTQLPSNNGNIYRED